MLIAIAVVLVAALAGGCSTVAQDSPGSEEPAGRIIATADFGDDLLLERRVPPDQSVMRALRGATAVETSYGGGFVAAMLGRESDPAEQRDWFYWVDGVLADVGARDRVLEDGEEAWWDYRDWSALADAWAVVGQWPAPFVAAGAEDRQVFVDEPLRSKFADAGARLSSDPKARFRVRVGSDTDLMGADPAWARASRDPDAAGLTAAIEDGQVTALGPDGEQRAPVVDARALAAAVPTGLEPKDGVLMVVAGLDRDAAERAAETIAREPGVLDRRFAVVFDGAGQPIGGPGEPPR